MGSRYAIDAKDTAAPASGLQVGTCCVLCFNRKTIWTIDSMSVSKWKPRVGKSSESSSQKRSQVEVESVSESGEDRQKLDEAVLALVGIREALEEWNALHQEQIRYLKGIMQALQGGDIVSREHVDSTLK